MTTYSIFVVYKSGGVFSILWKDEQASINSYVGWIKASYVKAVYRHEHIDGAAGVIVDAYEAANEL